MNRTQAISNVLTFVFAGALLASATERSWAGNPPPNVPGVCCIGPGGTICFPTNDVRSDCFDNGRSYIIGGTCSPNACLNGSGACCFVGNLCVENYDGNACAIAGGTYQGNGTTCSPNPCNAPVTGACCFTAAPCQMLTQNQCGTQGGVWLEFNSCIDSPCGQGACCTGTACLVQTAFDCINAGRVFVGAGTGCSPTNDCQFAPGACCQSETQCISASFPGCLEAGGFFYGVGTTCASVTCGVFACCFGGGNCTMLNLNDCNQQGGIWLSGEICSSNPCGNGACCTPTGCVQLDLYTCNANGYGYSGLGVPCSPDPCLQPCFCTGDVNVDFLRNGKDIRRFVQCIVANAGGPIVSGCECADTNNDGFLTAADVPTFISFILVGIPCQ